MVDTSSHLYQRVEVVLDAIANWMTRYRDAHATRRDLARCDKDEVSLSLAGTAYIVTDQNEFDRVCKLRLKRYPEYANLPPPILHHGDMQRLAPQPESPGIVLLRIAPEVISVLDYSKGFGHSDLITFSGQDLDRRIAILRHRWIGEVDSNR
jgi:hypothetical protein